MGFIHKGKQHHCPGQSKPVDGYPGNCRQIGGYCTAHMRLCRVHRNFAFMKSKTCTLCEKAARIADEEKKKKKNGDGKGDGNGDGGGAGGGGKSGGGPAKQRRQSGGKHKFGKRPRKSDETAA
ncbi:uncharacterized protein PAC_03469 [Phialocephala subalpina]|uniref:Uncharacterized protein n=1 Tax=Phialocephala subalpina TaxID=576137 RepID=A0A1L7WLE0_9HELO|nr:uncharacterized protein PAC_03469 [Phialocephala subalpina]